jgi:ribose 5-phosphate isomerase B
MPPRDPASATTEEGKHALDPKELEVLVRSVVERLLPATGGAGRVALGADHGGYPLKELLKAKLAGSGFEPVDVGTHSTEAVDYPDFAVAVARKVASGECRFGIMIDGAGIGSCMAANKIPGVRAALCYDLSTASNAREHNDANVLTLGAGLVGPSLAEQIALRFLVTECTEERHLRRVAKIDALDGAGARTP